MTNGKVNIYDKQKDIKLPTGIRLLIRRACVATLAYENFGSPAIIDVSLVNDEQIHKINLEQRNIDDSTDVLSFPLGENGEYDTDPSTGALMLGDIVLSVEHAVAAAELYGHTLQREIAFLVVHSVLHLLGYDHIDGGLAEMQMREKQDAILEELGLAIVK